MYLRHFGLTKKPFQVTPDADCFYQGANRKGLLDAVLHVLQNEDGFVKITGPVGSGKTSVLRYLVKKLPREFVPIIISDSALTPEQLIFFVADSLGMSIDRASAATVLVEIRKRIRQLTASGYKIALLVDEAHAMPVETLEQLRLLSQSESENSAVIRVVLFGLEELDHNLGLEELASVRDRIANSLKLKRLALSDIDEYLQFRLEVAGHQGGRVFSPNAVKLLATATNGLPRRINIMADKAMLSAAVENRYEVLVKDVISAAKDVKIEKSKPEQERWWFGAAGLALGLMLGAGIHAATEGRFGNGGGIHISQAIPEANSPTPGTVPAAIAAVSEAPAKPAEAAPAGETEKPAAKPDAVADGRFVPTDMHGRAVGAAAPTPVKHQPVEQIVGRNLTDFSTRCKAWMTTVDPQRYTVKIRQYEANGMDRIYAFIDRLQSQEDITVDMRQVHLCPSRDNRLVLVVYGEYADKDKADAAAEAFAEHYAQARRMKLARLTQGAID